MSKKAWQQMIAALNVLKAGIVPDDTPSAPEKPENEHPDANTPETKRTLGISEEARQVLERTSDGVPMYATPNLERIDMDLNVF